MTREGYERLGQELEYLKKVERPKNLAEIKHARSYGDLRENFEYDAARQNQGILEARIRDLERRIESAQIVESIETDKVGIGTRVKLRDLDYDEEMEYALVDDHSRSLGGDVEIVSPESPIGQALMNRLAGETVEVPVPAGILRLEILDIQTA